MVCVSRPVQGQSRWDDGWMAHNCSYFSSFQDKWPHSISYMRTMGSEMSVIWITFIKWRKVDCFFISKVSIFLTPYSMVLNSLFKATWDLMSWTGFCLPALSRFQPISGHKGHLSPSPLFLSLSLFLLKKLILIPGWCLSSLPLYLCLFLNSHRSVRRPAGAFLGFEDLG